MEKNKGMTLIELIVVIGIMGVVVGLIGLSFAVVSRQRLSSAASEVKGQFQTAQTIALSKDDCFIKIEKNSDDEVVFTTCSAADIVLDTCIISRKITVRIYEDGETTPIDLDHGAIIIKYIRQTGGFDYPRQGADELAKITTISFARGNGENEITLRLNKATGKVSYE